MLRFCPSGQGKYGPPGDWRVLRLCSPKMAGVRFWAGWYLPVQLAAGLPLPIPTHAAKFAMQTTVYIGVMLTRFHGNRELP